MSSHELSNFTDILGDVDEIANSQPISLISSGETLKLDSGCDIVIKEKRPEKYTGQRGEFRCIEEIDSKYRNIFSYPYFNLVQSRVIDDALYKDKSMVVCAPTGSGKTVVFEMAIVQLLMELEDKNYTDDFKIIYMAPVKALCTERLSEWYPKFTKLGLLCIEVTGDTDVDFTQLKPYRIIITTPEKWDMLTRRWRDHRSLVEVVKLFLIDEVHILNDESRGPVLEAVVSRMKTIETSAQTAHRLEHLQCPLLMKTEPPRIRFVAVSATVNNPEDVAAWLGNADRPAVYYKFGDECRPVKLRRIVEGYPCADGTSIFKFDIILNYKLWPIIQKYHDGKPTLIFCNTRKSVGLTAETLSKELTIGFTPEQKAKLTALASTIKNKKLQSLVLSGVGCHHAGLLFEERMNIEQAFRNRDLPILITTTTLAMGVNLPAHLVIIKNTQQYVNGAYQEYSISTILQMVGRAGRPQFDTEATAVIMTRLCDKPRYQALVGGSEPLQSYLHKRLPENLNSEAALGTVSDVAQCVQWVRSTFFSVRATKDPRRYLGLPSNAPQSQIVKKIEELCVKAMNSLASTGLLTMDEACCIESTEAGRLMSIYYIDLETMKLLIKIEPTETLERLLWIVCESHELSDMHLRMEERRCLNTLNRNNAAATIRFPMKGKITTRQMKLSCIIQAVLGCLPIPDPSLNQEALKVMRTAVRVCKCLVAYISRAENTNGNKKFYLAILNSLILAKCVRAQLWENSPYVSKQLKGIGPTFSTLLASAGKVNFMLLEESHPRDLERIMNKGPPAGNVLRKQISLLPKYQLTTMPVDEKSVTIQVTLLNQAFLAENIDHLTAGSNHKSYVIIGDTENNLLLFSSFKDKDLISVYDGTITYQINRRSDLEHKILAHCVSSDYVGIDAECEYTFKDVQPLFLRGEASTPNAEKKLSPPTNIKKATRQTTITDVYKERKRKNTDSPIGQSKEKKKRDTALVVKFKDLKAAFGRTSTQLHYGYQKPTEMTDKILQEIYYPENNDIDNVDIPSTSSNYFPKYYENANDDLDKEYPQMNIDEINDAEFVADERVDDILNEIEREISRNNCGVTNTFNHKTSISNNRNANIVPPYYKPGTNLENLYQKSKLKARKDNRSKTNYSFMDSIKHNMSEQDNEEQIVSKDSGFSNAIKSQLERFMQGTVNKAEPTNPIIIDLLNDENNTDNVKLLNGNDMIETEISLADFPEVKTLNAPNTFDDHSSNTNATSTVTENKHSTPETATSNNMSAINTINNNKEIIYNDNLPEHEDISHLKSMPNIKGSSVLAYNNSMSGCRPEYNDINSMEMHTVETRTNLNDYKHALLPINTNNDDTHHNIVLHNAEVKENYRTNYENSDITRKDGLTESSIIIKKIYPIDPTTISRDLNNTVISKGTGLETYNNSIVEAQDITGPQDLQLVRKVIPTESYIGPKEICQTLNTIDTFELGKTLALQPNDWETHDSNSSQVVLPSPSEFADGVLIKRFKNETSERTLNTFDSMNNINQKTSLKKKCFKPPLKEGTVDFNNSYINRYKYIATNVDVCSKTTPEHNVQIIRKTQIDVDVTEIVSKVQQRRNQTSDSQLSKEKYSSTNTPNTYDVKDTKSENIKAITNPDKQHPIDDEIIPLMAAIRVPNETNFINSLPDSVKPIGKETIINGKQTKHAEGYNKTKELQVSTSDLHVSKQIPRIIATHDKPLTRDKDQIDESSTEDTAQNYTKETTVDQRIKSPTSAVDNNIRNCKNSATGKPLNVQDILKKYSKLLSQNTNSNLAPGDTSFSQGENISEMAKITPGKKKRLYKISDISRLDVSSIPLPKIFVAESSKSASRSINDVVRSDVINEYEQSKECTNFRPPALYKPDTENKISDTNAAYNPIDDVKIDDEVFVSPSSQTDIETSDTGLAEQLDGSMLNPQTLLKCIATERNHMASGDLIPPPPQFCDDEYDNSNAYSPADCEFIHENIQEASADEIDDLDIFDDHSRPLTPTVEIETWTLSQDDEPPSRLCFNSNSRTVLHRMSPHYNSSPQTPKYNVREETRQSKLQNFKFLNKNKHKF